MGYGNYRHYFRFVLWAFVANLYTYVLVLRPHMDLGLGMGMDDAPREPWGSMEQVRGLAVVARARGRGLTVC